MKPIDDTKSMIEKAEEIAPYKRSDLVKALSNLDPIVTPASLLREEYGNVR